MTGGTGRNMSLNEVLAMSLPQLFFLCWDSQGETAKTGLEVKQSIDERCAADPEFKAKYQRSVQDAIKRAKDGLGGKE